MAGGRCADQQALGFRRYKGVHRGRFYAHNVQTRLGNIPARPHLRPILPCRKPNHLTITTAYPPLQEANFLKGWALIMPQSLGFGGGRQRGMLL